jgi:colanic acid biosynthesis glycosyl transferase WcaI
MEPDSRPKILLVYHFFHPDDVVSAREFSDLAEALAQKGWSVTALTSNRSYLGDREFPRHEKWGEVTIIRSYRLPWDHRRALPRLANSLWLVFAWFLEGLRLEQFDVVLVGTEPAFAPSLFVLLRPFQRRAKFVHWCFDLYPEAIVAEGMGRVSRWLAPLARRLMRAAYARCAAVVDLGPEMRRLLAGYGMAARQETLVPWALVEPGASAPDPKVRAELFPSAKLALLYSGTLGRAHDYETFLALAHKCREKSGNDISFCFVGRGNRIESLKSALTPADTNVRLAPFCEEAELQARLQSADLHLMSLKPEWDGVVVPSKFFGSLAAGRPVLFAGSDRSDIAQWIQKLDVGLVVNAQNIDRIADELHRFIADPAKLAKWQANALAAYSSQFSKRVVTEGWDALLRSVIAR